MNVYVRVCLAVRSPLLEVRNEYICVLSVK